MSLYHVSYTIRAYNTPLMNTTRRLLKVNDEISNPFYTELLYLLPFITRAQELAGPKHGIQFVHFNKIKFWRYIESQKQIKKAISLILSIFNNHQGNRWFYSREVSDVN